MCVSGIFVFFCFSEIIFNPVINFIWSSSSFCQIKLIKKNFIEKIDKLTECLKFIYLLFFLKMISKKSKLLSLSIKVQASKQQKMIIVFDFQFWFFFLKRARKFGTAIKDFSVDEIMMDDNQDDAKVLILKIFYQKKNTKIEKTFENWKILKISKLETQSPSSGDKM